MIKTCKNICYVTDEFIYDEGSLPLKAHQANTCEDNRVLWCTTLAAVSRGQQYSKNPDVRYKKLLKEAAPMVSGGQGTPSRPLEFVPVVLNCKINTSMINVVEIKLNNNITDYMSMYKFMNLLSKFGFVTDGSANGEFKLHTNIRAILNAGIKYDLIPYNTEEELALFKAVRVRAPMFVFNHLVTHTMLSKEARSERVVDYIQPQLNELYPEPFNQPFWKPDAISDDLLDKMINVLSFKETMELLKELNYPKEIYQRAILEWRYKDFMMVGWYNELTWMHLFKERGADDDYTNWTQNETKETVKTIKEVVTSVSENASVFS